MAASSTLPCQRAVAETWLWPHPTSFGQVFLHQEGLAFITTLIFRTCEIVDLGTLPVARPLAGW